MNLNIRAGMRVLYKHNNQWEVGALAHTHSAVLTDKGLFLYVIPKKFIGMDEQHVSYLYDVELNDLFFDAFKIEDCYKDYHQYFMTKEDYIAFTESEDFDRHHENAYVSDGEYGYYPISKFTRTWLEKQPFDYVVRGEV